MIWSKRRFLLQVLERENSQRCLEESRAEREKKTEYVRSLDLARSESRSKPERAEHRERECRKHRDRQRGRELGSREEARGPSENSRIIRVSSWGWREPMSWRTFRVKRARMPMDPEMCIRHLRC